MHMHMMHMLDVHVTCIPPTARRAGGVCSGLNFDACYCLIPSVSSMDLNFDGDSDVDEIEKTPNASREQQEGWTEGALQDELKQHTPETAHGDEDEQEFQQTQAAGPRPRPRESLSADTAAAPRPKGSHRPAAGGSLHKRDACSMVKVQPGQCPSSAPAPPRGKPDGSGRLGTPRERQAHWAPRHCLGCSS